MADEAQAGGTVSDLAPRGSWGTFKNQIERVVQAPPNRIDRTWLVGMAGSAQTEVLQAFRALKLISPEGKPTTLLQALAVPEEAERKKRLAAIFREHYAAQIALDLTKATPGELNESMSQTFQIEGSTRKKAVRFFLSGLEYVGIQVAPIFKRSVGNGAPPTGEPRKRRTPRPVDDEKPDDRRPARGMTRTVKLKSGGELTLSVSIDLFELDKADMDFVLDFVNKLKGYEQEAK